MSHASCLILDTNDCCSNTQERKPVTNSRDTQELLPDAGQEMLRIFHSHPSRTSLLQDYAFYEVRTGFCYSLLRLITTPPHSSRPYKGCKLNKVALAPILPLSLRPSPLYNPRRCNLQLCQRHSNKTPSVCPTRCLL